MGALAKHVKGIRGVLQGWDNAPSLLANTEFLEIGRRLALTRAFQGQSKAD